MAISLSPDGVLTLPAINGGNRLCICRDWLSVWIFHNNCTPLTLSFVRIVSLRCHDVRCASPPSVSQSAFRLACAPGTAVVHAAAAHNTAADAQKVRLIKDASPVEQPGDEKRNRDGSSGGGFRPGGGIGAPLELEREPGR